MRKLYHRKLFQSTPSQRGRLMTIETTRICAQFQSTPSQRGRPAENLRLLCVKEFQSTPSQRGRQAMCIAFATMCGFQSTPSQRGRQTYIEHTTHEDGISIHALAKRATQVRYVCASTITFQSTPSQRGRQSSHSSLCDGGNFNPRPRKEGDLLRLS